MKSKTRKSGGFIALMTVIIVSVVLLIVATNLSFTGLYNRSNILDSELKKVSSALAKACVDTAILNLANDPTYNPSNEVVDVDGNECIIESVITGAGTKTILINTDLKNYITKLKVVIDETSLEVLSWEEL